MKAEIIEKLQSLLKENSLDEKDLLWQLKQIIEQNEFHLQLEVESKSMAHLMADKLQILEENKDGTAFIKSGFTELDNILGGFATGELIVFGGRPGMGKTTVLANITANIAAKNEVLYFTFDLSGQVLLNRFLGIFSELPTFKLEKNELTDEEKVYLKKTIESFQSIPVFIREDGSRSLSLFKAICEKEVAEKGIKVIVIDYLQMMRTHRFKNNREIEISMIMRELKTIARELYVCILISSQLSRSVETRGGDKRPYLSDLRESGAIEQDADKVIFVYRPEYYGLLEDENGFPTEGILDLIVAKNRTGGLNTARLGFDKSTGKMKNVTNQINDSFFFRKERLDEIKTDEAPF